MVVDTKVQNLLQDGTLTGDWVIDPGRSKVELASRHTWGLRPLHGVFREVTGAGTVSPTGEVSGTLSVLAASVDTKNAKRDSDLRSARFFDVERHPAIVVTVDRVVPGADGATVQGSLTVRDTTLPLSFPVQVAVTGDEVTVEGEAQVNRKDFGLTFNMLGMASMENTLAVTAVFTKR